MYLLKNKLQCQQLGLSAQSSIREPSVEGELYRDLKKARRIPIIQYRSGTDELNQIRTENEGNNFNSPLRNKISRRGKMPLFGIYKTQRKGVK